MISREKPDFFWYFLFLGERRVGMVRRVGIVCRVGVVHRVGAAARYGG